HKVNKNQKVYNKAFTLAATAVSATPAVLSANSATRSISKTHPFLKSTEDSGFSDLNALVEAYYGNPDDVSDISRAKKMQAFIMELAIKAKSRNPNFQVIP